MLALCPTARPLVLQHDGELFVPVAHGCALLVIFFIAVVGGDGVFIVYLFSCRSYCMHVLMLFLASLSL